MCGGYTNNNEYTNKCHILASNGRWFPFNNLIQPRSWFSMTMITKQVVIIGGENARYSIEYINIEQGSKWVKKNLDFDVTEHCTVPINNSTIMVIGGVQDGKVFRHFILLNYHIKKSALIYYFICFSIQMNKFFLIYRDQATQNTLT